MWMVGDHDQRSEDGYVYHSSGCHEHHLSHCRRCSQSHHWPGCTSSNAILFHVFQSGKAYLQQKSLHFYKNHYYSSGLVIPGYVKGSILKWDDPEYTIFDPQSTGQVMAEIDFELNSEARLTQSKEQEEDVSQEAQRPQCLKVPESVTSAEKEAQFLTCLSGHGAQPVKEQKISNIITKASRTSPALFSWIIVSTKFQEKLRISRCSQS